MGRERRYRARNVLLSTFGMRAGKEGTEASGRHADAVGKVGNGDRGGRVRGNGCPIGEISLRLDESPVCVGDERKEIGCVLDMLRQIVPYGHIRGNGRNNIGASHASSEQQAE